MIRSSIALAAAVISSSQAVAAPTVSGAWIRANPVTGRPSAGYLTVTGDTRPDRLLAVTSPGLRIEMHSMATATGIMRMARIDGLDVPVRGKAEFTGGGNHLMIYGLSAAARTAPLTLRFRSGAKVTVAARVRAAADVEDHAGH